MWDLASVVDAAIVQDSSRNIVSLLDLLKRMKVPRVRSAD